MIENKVIGRINTDDADHDLAQDIRDCLNLVPQDNGLGQSVSRDNVKGNVKVSTVTRPDGTNKTIGRFTDKDNQRLFQFVYNSNGDHSIYVLEKEENREYKVFETNKFNWSESTKITGAGIIDDQLVFTDAENEIRSIDVERGKNTFDVSEKRKWDILLDPDSDTDFNVTVHKSNGSEFSAQVNINNIETILNQWVAGGVTAEKCENTVEVIEEVAGDIDQITVTGVHAVAPRNIYSLPITDRQITLINYPLPCPPEISYKTDETRTVNFLLDKSFQFAIKYIYFDDSFSSISPYSKLAAKKDCGTSSTKIDNYIEVTFSDDKLTEEELMLIKNVEVLFRFGNAGNFYKAVTLERDEFFAGKYDFYNDGGYNAVPNEEVSKPFDYVPNKANALTLLKNRLFVGGYTEGYETPCIDANLTVDLEESSGGVGNTWDITGRVRIVNRFLNFLDSGKNGTSHTNQPIHSRSGQTTREDWVYGGLGGFDGENASENDHAAHKQYIPEGGFTIYLAGTNYFDISKQFTKSYSDPVNNDASVVREDPIVYDTNKNGNTLDANNENGRASVRRIMDEDNVYSTFTIKSVPPGKYILRVASPLCARTENLRSDTDPYYDLNGNIADWQSTSANVIDINGDPDTYQSNVDEFYPSMSTGKELVIELGEDGGVYDIHQGDSDNAILIADLIDISFVVGYERSAVNQGYLVDAEEKNEDGFAASLRMENQKIGVTSDTLTFWSDLENNNLGNGSEYTMKTDHNGFYWFGFNGNALSSITGQLRLTRTIAYNGGVKNTASFPVVNENENNVYEIKHWNQTHYRDADISDVYNGNVLTKTEQKDWVNDGGTTNWIMYNYNSRIRDYGRTIVQGKVVDNEGNPLSSLFSQITQTNRNEQTDSEGFFNIIVYADEDLTLPQMQRTGTVFIGRGTNACVSFTDKDSAFNAQPIEINGFNNENPYNISDIVIDDLIENTSSIHKRGGIYKWGLVYYDEALRSSFVATNDGLRKRIPFITDDLGITLPDQYSSPEFRYGNAFIEWEINSRPPEWAHHYQWVRTKDTAHQTFFTWSANKVLYVKEWDLENEEPIETTFGSSEANEVYLDISNLEVYSNANSDAKLGYIFSEGDRCILIKNDGEYFDTYIDVEVKGQRGQYIVIENTGSLVELKEGLLFQVYTPKLQNETEIYYEIGECYDILNPGTESRSHSVPTGSFEKGDAYTLGRNVTTDIGSVTEDYEHPTIADKITERYSDIGRPNIVNLNAKEKLYSSSVRFGNLFVEDAFINGISSFDFSGSYPIPLERGEITGMVGTTNVILVTHRTESTSLYIGEGFLQTPNGGGLLSKTDGVIGDENLLKGEYGTINPESIVEYDDVIYFWDQNKGEIIRYSNNGLTPLGLTAKYRNFLLGIQEAKKSNTVSQTENSVYGGYNPIFDMAIMTFKNINGEDVTVSFHERNDAFMTRFSFFPEMYGYIDTKMYSMKDGELWEHDINSAPRNNFYGVQYPSLIRFVSNMSDQIEKIYRSIGIKSNDAWAATRIFNKDGQESDLLTTDFVLRDNMYYADILRDKNTPIDTLLPGQIPLAHGREMRSQVMEFIIENTNTDQVEIDSIIVDVQQSPGHLIQQQG